MTDNLKVKKKTYEFSNDMIINALQQAAETKCGRAATRKDKGNLHGRKNFEFKKK